MIMVLLCREIFKLLNQEVYFYCVMQRGVCCVIATRAVVSCLSKYNSILVSNDALLSSLRFVSLVGCHL
jgi:hypothetical protein